MQINIKTHFEEAKQPAQKQVDDANTRRSKLESDLADLKVQRDKQSNDRYG